MASQQAENRRLIALTTAFTSVLATQFVRMVEIEEDGSVTPVGLLVKFPNDNFTAVFDYEVGQQPVVLGNKIAHGNAFGEIIGWPAQSGLPSGTQPATTLCQVAAKTGTTTIRVTEYN